jgi:hypothetical protein
MVARNQLPMPCDWTRRKEYFIDLRFIKLDDSSGCGTRKAYANNS